MSRLSTSAGDSPMRASREPSSDEHLDGAAHGVRADVLAALGERDQLAEDALGEGDVRGGAGEGELVAAHVHVGVEQLLGGAQALVAGAEQRQQRGVGNGHAGPDGVRRQVRQERCFLVRRDRSSAAAAMLSMVAPGSDGRRDLVRSPTVRARPARGPRSSVPAERLGEPPRAAVRRDRGVHEQRRRPRAGHPVGDALQVARRADRHRLEPVPAPDRGEVGLREGDGARGRRPGSGAPRRRSRGRRRPRRPSAGPAGRRSPARRRPSARRRRPAPRRAAGPGGPAPRRSPWPGPSPIDWNAWVKQNPASSGTDRYALG